MTDHSLLQSRLPMMRSALDRMKSDLQSLEKQRAPRRPVVVSSLLVMVTIGIFASFAFAQTSVVWERVQVPFAVIDHSNRPILIVKADATGRGAYVYSEEGKIIAVMASSPDGAGGFVKAVSPDNKDTYVGLHAFPATLGCTVRSQGKQLAFAGKTDAGNAAVQVLDAPSELAQAILMATEGQGRIEIRNKANNIIAVMTKSKFGGGAVETFDKNNQGAFWARGTANGGDVCVSNPHFGEYCLGLQN
jgi:hypothetical protein